MPDTRVLIMGFAFKENCPDVRNTRVIDIYEELIDYGIEVDVFDPVVSGDEVLHEYGFGNEDVSEFRALSSRYFSCFTQRI